MDLEIINKDLRLDIYGFSGTAINKDYAGNRGFETTLPYIEIYGHWTNDETKLETELLMSLK
jgi:hypothetical protein